MPASMFKYGSIFIEVTCKPQDLRRAPRLLAITPFPRPLITPPVTRMYFILQAKLRSIFCFVHKTVNKIRAFLFESVDHVLFISLPTDCSAVAEASSILISRHFGIILKSANEC